MNRKLVGGAIIALFFLLIVFGISIMTLQRDIVSPRNGSNSLDRNNGSAIEGKLTFRESMEATRYSVYYIIIAAALGGLLIGALVYYVLSERTTKQQFDKNAFREALLTTMSKQEQEVVNLLLENNGSVPQYELTRLSGMNKVQTHRLLLKMEKSGLITKKHLGKINKIELNKSFKILV